jgi:hypothetical protein
MVTPSEAQALESRKAVQSLPAKKLDQFITLHIGDDMLEAFMELAESQFPDDDRDDRAKQVHLMILAYLMRVHIDGKLDRKQ